MSSYKGKKAFITGGSAGIGRAAALQLCHQGASVFIAARRQEQLDATLAEMRQGAAKDAVVGAVVMDVTDRSAVREQAKKVLQAMCGLDILICNSGSAQTGCTLDVDDETYEAMINVNYFGHVNVVRAFLAHFAEQKSGNICLVSSMLGFMGLYGYGAYAASKFAIIGFAEALRQEMGLCGVNVSVCYPPTTDTPGLEEENKDKPPIVWALESESGWNKTYTADEVATTLLRGIERQKFSIVVGFDSWLIYTLNRHLPGITHWIADRELRDAAKKVAESPK